MGAVESVLREVEKVTVRPLGQVARTVEREAIRPLGEVARDVERVTIRPLGQVLRGAERGAIRPVTDLAKDSILMIGRVLDLVKPDADLPPNTDMQAMEANIKELAEKERPHYEKLQGDINEEILRTPPSEADRLNFLGELYESNSQTWSMLEKKMNRDEAIKNNEAYTREYHDLLLEKDSLEKKLEEQNNHQE